KSDTSFQFHNRLRDRANPARTRRVFLHHAIAGTFGLLSAAAFNRVFAAAAIEEKLEPFKGADIFDRILSKAVEGKWAALPVGECMGRIANELEGTCYVGFTH